MSDGEWYAKVGEVLQKTRDGSLHHVHARLRDADNGDKRYELDDDTHTTRSFWHEEDLKADFEKTDVIVEHSVKPKHRLDGRLYDGE